MSKRFYEVKIHPKNDECPSGENDCNGCEFCKYYDICYRKENDIYRVYKMLEINTDDN